MDTILALRLLYDLHREFDRPLNESFLDIKAAFDSVDRRVLWKALRSRGIPDFLLDLIAALHENTGVRVRLGQNFSDRIQTTSGVRQGCVLAPALFSMTIDWILRLIATRPEIGHDHFGNLVYADDTTLLVNSASKAASCPDNFKDTAATLGLRVSWPKTKLQNLGAGSQLPTQGCSLSLD